MVLNYQLYPVSTLAVILARGKSLSIYGDLIWGIVLLVIYSFLALNLNFWVLSLCLIVSTFAIFGFFLMINSLLFFLPNVVTLQNFILEVFIGAGFYPSQNFTGVIKVILWLIPVFPIIFIPLEVSHNFLSAQNLIYTFLVAILLNFVGFWLWNKGLAKTESGNQAGSVE